MLCDTSCATVCPFSPIHGLVFETGGEFPYCRKKGSLRTVEQVMLDGNAMAKGHEYFYIGAAAVSPDGRLLAYTEDLVGRRQFTLRVKNLQTGAILSDRSRVCRKHRSNVHR